MTSFLASHTLVSLAIHRDKSMWLTEFDVPAVFNVPLHLFGAMPHSWLVMCMSHKLIPMFDATTVNGDMAHHWSFGSTMTMAGQCCCWLLIFCFSAGRLDFWWPWQGHIKGCHCHLWCDTLLRFLFYLFFSGKGCFLPVFAVAQMLFFGSCEVWCNLGVVSFQVEKINL